MWPYTKELSELKSKLNDLEERMPERTVLDEIERDKDNSRVTELERMVTELRAANIEIVKQLKDLDVALTNMQADFTTLQNMQTNFVTTVTPEDNYYAVMDTPVTP